MNDFSLFFFFLIPSAETINFMQTVTSPLHKSVCKSLLAHLPALPSDSWSPVPGQGQRSPLGFRVPLWTSFISLLKSVTLYSTCTAHSVSFSSGRRLIELHCTREKWFPSWLWLSHCDRVRLHDISNLLKQASLVCCTSKEDFWWFSTFTGVTLWI